MPGSNGKRLVFSWEQPAAAVDYAGVPADTPTRTQSDGNSLTFSFEEQSQWTPEDAISRLLDFGAKIPPGVQKVQHPLTPAPPPPPPASLYPPDWETGKELAFREWYKGWSETTGISPDPDDPRHLYDYRSAYQNGAFPEPDSKGEYHWPSEYKMPDHPNRFVDGVDVITGKPITVDQALTLEQRRLGVTEPHMEWWRAIGRSFVAGSMDAVDTYARAGRVLGLETSDFIENLEKARKDYSTEGVPGILGWITGGIEATINSLASGLPGGVVGMKGGPVGSVLGFALGAGTLFSLAEYDRFMEEAEALGLKRSDVMIEGVASALAEGGIEVLQDLVLAKVFGLLAKQTLKAPVKEGIGKLLKKYFKNVSKAMPVEIAGEIATGHLQTELRQAAGFPIDDMTLDEMIKTGGVTAVQTLLMGAGAAAVSHRERMKEFKRYQENKEQWWQDKFKELGIDVGLTPPKEEVPKEMGAYVPSAEPGAEPGAEPVEPAAATAAAELVDFPNIKEAQRAGVVAEPEEIEAYKEKLQDLKDDVEFFTEQHRSDLAMAATRQANRVQKFLEASEEPERYAAMLGIDLEKAPEVEAMLSRIDEKYGVTEEGRAPEGYFDFYRKEDRDWLRSLGYTEEQIEQAAKYPRARMRGGRQVRLEHPSAIPGAVAGEAELKKKPVVAKSYVTGMAEAAPEQNIISRPAEKPGRVLLAQIAPSATATVGEPAIADSYFNKLYTAREGYSRPDDFWEVPLWIPMAAASVPDSDMMAIRSPETAASQIQEAGYEAVMFSAMDVNKHVIKRIAELLGSGTRVIVGGYVNKSFFKDTPNVEFYNSLQDAVSSLGVEYKEGQNTKHFKDTPTIPRLCMSTGCLHKCAFCTVPKEVKPSSDESIDVQLDNMRDLKFKLVYLDDKTFGQAKNYKKLPEIFSKIRSFNKNFQGFIIQTTAPQFLKLDDAFLQEAGIKFVELGVESYNNDILAKIHKPARVATIDKAVEKMRTNKIAFIPNILVGLTGKGWSETPETYKNTLEFLENNADIISHVNVYNLALYEGTELAEQIETREDIDLDENRIEKSYHKDPKVHDAFYRAVVKFGEKQLDRTPFSEEVTTEAALKRARKEEAPQLGLFKEKKKKERLVPVWIDKKEDAIEDEETGEKVKVSALTPEAREALEKAKVGTGMGRYLPGQNFVVSVTEKAGGLIYGKARKGDVRVERKVDTLTGVRTIVEYFRTIAGKKFKVLDTPIMPRTKKAKVELVDSLLNEYSEELDWYKNWRDYMMRFTNKNFTEKQIENFIKIQAILSAGASPQGAQTAFGKVMDQLERHPEYVRGGEGRGITTNMADKINTILSGKDVGIQTLEQYQKAYGMKIGAMVFAGLHPASREGVVVVDRHIARLWGYNVMYSGAFRVPKHVQAEIVNDIVDTAKRHDLPVPAVQAALWYAAGAGHWGSATHFEDSIKISPKKSLGYAVLSSITEEPQSIVHFGPQLFFSVRGPYAPTKLTVKEHARLKDLRDRHNNLALFGGLTDAERLELLELTHKQEGEEPNSWSRNDVKARMEAGTPDNPYVPLGYWYGPGVRREVFFWGSEPMLTHIYETEIYDAVEDTLGYREAAWKRALNDSEVKAGHRTPESIFTNTLAAMINKAGVTSDNPQGDFKGFSVEENGHRVILTFGEMAVAEHPKEVTVALSDRVSSVGKLPTDLSELANVGGNLAQNLSSFLKKGLEEYPVTIVKQEPTLARFVEATSNQEEYGLSVKVRGPLSAIRAAFSDIIGLQRTQNFVYVFHTEGASNGTLVRFTFKETDISKIQNLLKRYGIAEFNLKWNGANWVYETFVYGSAEDSDTVVTNIEKLYKNHGVNGTLEHKRVLSEQLVREPVAEEPIDYKSHLLKYFGKKKGEERYEESRQKGAQWTADYSVTIGAEAAVSGVERDRARKERRLSDRFRKPEASDVGAEALLGGSKIGAISSEQRSALQRAQRMQRDGESVDSIWRDTGWIKGVEGLWRFEVADTKSKIDLANVKKNFNSGEFTTLDGILRHEELYKFYPELREVKVAFGNLKKGRAVTLIPSGHIVLDKESVKEMDEFQLLSTVLHEVQHVIQYVEGFTLGTGDEAELEFAREVALTEDEAVRIAEQTYLDNAGEIEAFDTEARLDMSAEDRRNTPPYDSADIPMDKWIIRSEGTSFAIDHKKAPKRSLAAIVPSAEVALDRVKQLGAASETILQALKASGLEKYPEVLKRTQLILKPFLDAKDLGKGTLASWAARFNTSIAELEKELSTGDIAIEGFTAITDSLHALMNVALATKDSFADLEDTFYHEIWHLAERWVVPPKLYSKLTKWTPNFEERADSFRDYIRNRMNERWRKDKESSIPLWIRDLWDSIIDFLYRVRRAVLNAGIKSPDQVFEMFRRGQMTPHFQDNRRLVNKISGYSADPTLVAELDDVEYGDTPYFFSVSDDRDFSWDDEKVAKKRIRTMIEGWGPEASLKSWIPEPGQASEEPDHDLPSILELPEIVEIYELLRDGKLPGVRKMLNKQGTARGVFFPKRGFVRLKADIFRDPYLANRVLAHEIGHLVDWLPDHMIRGGILSKISSIRNFIGRSLPFKPGALGPLTQDDVQRLRGEAIKLLGMTQVQRQKWVDTSIVEETPIESTDILNIWNSVEEARLLSPDLYKYVAGLDTQAKKLIVKEALKGIVADELKRFAKILRKIERGHFENITEYIPPSEQDILKKLTKMVEDEIRKRKLWIESEIHDELKTLSARWRPFDPENVDRGYVAYRWSNEELYADAVSALFTDPAFLRAQAPKFYEAFFNWLENKPQVKRVYEEIQDTVRSGALKEHRLQRLYEMFKSGNDDYGKQYDQLNPPLKDELLRDFFDAFHFIIKDVRKFEKEIAPADNPRFALSKMVYTGSEIEGFLTDLYSNVIKPLEAANLKWDKEFGALTMLRRIVHEGRGMAEPLGWTEELAMEQIASFRDHLLTKDQWDAYKLAAKNFRKLHEEYFINKAEKFEIYPDDMIKMFRDNTHYATWDVAHFLRQRYGRAVATRVAPRVGTLQRITNPATATVMKDIAFIKAVNRNHAVRTTVKFFLDYKNHLGIDIKEAPKKWNGRFQAIQEPDRDSPYGLLTYLYKGKAYGYWVPKEIAAAINDHTVGYTSTSRIFRWLAAPMRKIFTELNYGFWIFNAFFRDAQRMVMALPGWRVDKFAKHWVKGLRPAFKSVFGIPDDVVQQMQKEQMLISVADVRGLNTEDEQIERLLRMYHMKGPEVYHSKIIKPFGHLFNWVGNRARLAEHYFTATGKALERTTKIGTYTYLKDAFPELSDEVVRQMVIERGGSPDFLRSGKEQSLYNNILLFVNAMKEGYRGDWTAFKGKPGEFLMKKMVFLAIPKLLMFAGILGLLGEAIKRIFDGVSEYDFTNYIIIPLGVTQTGRSVYWRIPTDETSRFLGGILAKALRAPEVGITEQASSLFDYMAGQAPTVSPALSAVVDVIDYASGRNPYDRFYGRHAVGEVEFQAKDSRAHLQFLKYLAGKMGASIVYKFKHDKVERVAEELEEILGFPINSKVADFVVNLPDEPVVSNVLGRFLKVSDYGVREDILRAKKDVSRDNARSILDAREAAWALVEGEMPTNKQLIALMQKPDVVQRQMMLALARKYGMVYFEEWVSSTTKEQKAAVLIEMFKKNALAGQDIKKYLPAGEPPQPSAKRPELPGLDIKQLMEKE